MIILGQGFSNFDKRVFCLSFKIRGGCYLQEILKNYIASHSGLDHYSIDFLRMVNSISDCSHVELVGWITLAIITASLVYNVLHFVYTTFLGSLLGCNINLKKCGPWAGIFAFLF